MTTFSASKRIPDDIEELINIGSLGSGLLGAASGMFGVPADVPLQGAGFVLLGMSIAEKTGHSMNEDTMKKIVYGVSTGIVSLAVGAKIGTALFSWLAAIPTGGLSLLVGAAVGGALSAKIANAFARALALYFLQADSVSDSDLAIEILLALIALQLGISPKRSDVTN